MAKLQPSVKVSAAELFKEYKADWKAAAAKYQGKILEVSGIVERTGNDSAGSLYVNLKGQENLGGVQCFFSKPHSEEASRVKPGQNLTLKGRCTVYVINVVLEECAVVK
jgi:hypothetical protein